MKDVSGWGWANKGSVDPRPAPTERESKLTARLRRISTPDLATWVDASLSKIGLLVEEAQKPGQAAMFEHAEEEADALLQAIRELAARDVV